MDNSTDLQKVISIAIGKVDPRKLEKLEQKLEEALGSPLSSQLIDDPIVIRRRLAELLRNEGVSPGVIHSFEQLFMGIIRRASIEGLIPAPPEGPWTRDWQSVLDMTSKTQKAKSLLRSLASWATARGFTPKDIEANRLKVWKQDRLIDEQSLYLVENILIRWSLTAESGIFVNDSLLSERLQKKALQGTVKAETQGLNLWR